MDFSELRFSGCLCHNINLQSEGLYPSSPFFFLIYEVLLHLVSSLGLLRVSQIDLKNLTAAQVLQALCNQLYPNITVPLEPKCSLGHSVK